MEGIVGVTGNFDKKFQRLILSYTKQLERDHHYFTKKKKKAISN